MIPIIKNFKGEASGLDTVDSPATFTISWDYLSIPTETIGAQIFTIPNNLITAEFILCWNTTTVTPYYAAIDEVLQQSLIPIAWYTDTYFLEYYFYSADKIWPSNKVELNIPKKYKDQAVEPLIPNQNFRSNNKNYPGKALGTFIPQYPGMVAGPANTNYKSESITDCLTKSFLDQISKAESLVKQSWDTTFGPSTGTEFSAYLQGLNREDYDFKDYIPSLLKSLVYKTVNNEPSYDTLFITELDNYLAISLNTIYDFIYTDYIEIPADLALKIIDKPGNRPISVYNADGKEGDTFTFTTNNKSVSVFLLPERYEPLIPLEQIINQTDFIRGFKYTYQPGQILPLDFIITGPNTGRYPSLAGVRYPLDSFKLFEGKNTEAVINFLFKLFKLRRGFEYDNSADIISTGPKDFIPLSLFSLPPLTADFIVEEDGPIVGNENNLLTVFLPFSYKRDGLEWLLAHKICEAFLFNYTIGYHEFTADFSVAEEPVNSIKSPEPAPIYLDTCQLFTARENYSVSYNTSPPIINPNSVSYNTSPSIINPNSVSYNTN